MMSLTSLLTSIVRQPLVALPLEISSIELRALLLSEVSGALWAVLGGDIPGDREVRERYQETWRSERDTKRQEDQRDTSFVCCIICCNRNTG